MSALSGKSVAIVVEVLWDALPSSRYATTLFLDQIMRSQGPIDSSAASSSSSSGSGPPPLLDLAVLLIAAPMDSDIYRKTQLMARRWLQQGRFPFGALKDMLHRRSQVPFPTPQPTSILTSPPCRRNSMPSFATNVLHQPHLRQNEVWDRLTPQVWMLCQQAMEDLVETRLVAADRPNDVRGSGSGSGSKFTCSASSSLFELIALLYDSAPSTRDDVLGSLAGMCYSIDGGSSGGGSCVEEGALAALGSSTHLLLRRIGLGSPSSDSTQTAFGRLRAVLAASVLLHLLCSGSPRVEVGLTLLQSLSDRLAYAQGRAQLPSAPCLHLLAQAAAFTTSLSPQVRPILIAPRPSFYFFQQSTNVFFLYRRKVLFSFSSKSSSQHPPRPTPTSSQWCAP